ncbi:hypothetical protein DPMN_018123 [Dreissena polymorpha]|uniref:beta-N-acetylhexosaminidase n=2 Tax=Dreissena polymorpha TaxID=45954 RepID=A0A9D4S832_DREPO|nr:hypothetical protein DPMN_018123 [Dreissena polymorpha]
MSVLFKQCCKQRKVYILVVIIVAVLLVGYSLRNSMSSESFTENKGVDVVNNMEQEVIEYIAKYVQISIRVTGYESIAIHFINTGKTDVNYGKWRIYFYAVRQLSAIRGNGLALKHENGGLYFFEPVEREFKYLKSGFNVTFDIEHYQVASKSDFFPNWYVASTAEQTRPRVLKYTEGDKSFVKDFTRPDHWKQGPHDNNNPLTNLERYQYYRYLNNHSISDVQYHVIPTPKVMTIRSRENVEIDRKWTLCLNKHFLSAGKYLAEALNLKIRDSSGGKMCISMIKAAEYGSEEYSLEVQVAGKAVEIKASTEAGAFYGVQTLLSVMSKTKIITDIFIKDQPRFQHRGLMIDVARNFVKKATILKVLDVMSMYKLNVLHLHLSDDEGWRLELPSIPELTLVGAHRCHNAGGSKCLNSSLGSGPYPDTSGSGFYSVNDFKEILRYAASRHVKVVPEIDVPGHSLAAVASMNYRQNVILASSENGGNSEPSYLLMEPERSVLGFNNWLDSAINPCLNTTYHFIRAVFNDLVDMYDGIQTFDLIHVGADEVYHDTWAGSPACDRRFGAGKYTHDFLKDFFLKQVSAIAADHNARIVAWEDGLYNFHTGPYDRAGFKNKEVCVQAWNNIWEMNRGGRSIEFANAGYPVILSMATHLYFDHPYEPDPEERGFYWATRYTDTFKVFGFMPGDLFANANFDRLGNRLSKEGVCRDPKNCPELRNPANIKGMEACLWTETIRSEHDVFYMLFPRVIALAERAWHEASWETNEQLLHRELERSKDWGRFLSALSLNELPRLAAKGVTYRVPPPGVNVNVEENVFRVTTLYANHLVEASVDDGLTWSVIEDTFPITKSLNISIRSRSPYTNIVSRTLRESIYRTNDAEDRISFLSHILLNVYICRLFYLSLI